jgi:hypothetical protein
MMLNAHTHKNSLITLCRDREATALLWIEHTKGQSLPHILRAIPKKNSDILRTASMLEPFSKQNILYVTSTKTGPVRDAQ